MRTKQSADAFLQGLGGGRDSLIITEENDDTGLRFYDAPSSYKTFEKDVDKGSMMLSLDKAENITAVNDAVISQFFNQGILSKLNESSAHKICC